MQKKTEPQTGDADKAQALRLFEQGRECWCRDDRAGALTCYNRSVALWPDGPAKTALEMATRIMDFFDRQQFNP